MTTLINTWNQIKDSAINSIAPALIHQESEIIKRTLRDLYDDNTKNIFVEGNEGYKSTIIHENVDAYKLKKVKI